MTRFNKEQIIKQLDELREQRDLKGVQNDIENYIRLQNEMTQLFIRLGIATYHESK